ncbi:MAG: acetyl-CoA C-acyltransferase [Novosphingobium sp.]
MHEAVIVDILRTPMGKGKPGGALSGVHPVDLLASVMTDLVERNKLDPGTIDDVLVGCVSQVGEQSATPGRMAVLAAGFPTHVPATTIDRKCGSSQQALHFAAQGIMAGSYDIAIAGGVESMSRVRMGSARLDADPYGAGVAEKWAPGLVSQGVAAELVAQRWEISRQQMDEFAARSHELAASASDSGAFDAEISAVATDAGRVIRDETIRPGTSVERLAELDAVFQSDAIDARFPGLDWGVTAGNSSQITDGASAALVMNRAVAERLGLKPRARFVAFDVIGDDPLLMLTAPIEATRRVLAKAGLSLSDIDHFEVNEAFASVPIAWAAEFDLNYERLNPHGGAIALGHPLGASGTRLLATMQNRLERTGGRYGLQTMCEAGGMANATIIENLVR